MEISLSCTFLMMLMLIHDSYAIVERLSAGVARQNVVRSLYLKAKETRGTSRREIIEPDPDLKNRICLWILGSSEYTAFGRRPVDKEEISIQLLRRYPEMFEKLYEHVDIDSFDKVYVNPTVSIYVSVSADREPYLENVFSCLDRNADPEKEPEFREYFVSQEYNVSDFPGPFVAARFVFRRSRDDGDFVRVVGIAEESAAALLGADWSENILSLFRDYVFSHRDTSDTLHLNIERLYLLKKKKNPPAEIESKNRICQLGEDERYRLCTLVFTSKYFDGKVKLPASYLMVRNYPCSLNRVKFRRHDVRGEVVDKYPKEWMILCYTTGIPFKRDDAEYDKAYYLSLVEKNRTAFVCSNDVFVYCHGEFDWRYNLNYYLVNVFTNIRLAL